jgi:hypothetical protein
MGVLAFVVLLLILDVSVHRWGTDSRRASPQDRFWWPNG